MRRIMICGAVACLAMIGTALAQPGTPIAPQEVPPPPASLATADDVLLYLRHIKPDVWLTVMKQTVDTEGLDGLDGIAVWNPSVYAVTKIDCGGYTFAGVGADKSIATWNFRPLDPRSVTIEHTNGWNGYCPGEINARDKSGSKLSGILDKPGDFTHSDDLILKQK